MTSKHFTHSRVMVWAAFDRAVAAVEQHGLDGPVERWRELREQVRQEVLDPAGSTRERGTFVAALRHHARWTPRCC